MAPLVTSLVLVLVLGTLAAWGNLTTAKHVDSAQREDRLRLERTLAGLTNQYLRFTLFETADAAGRTGWSGRPGDGRDEAALTAAVRTSPFALFGAALVTGSGQVISAYAPLGLPQPSDPGLAPLRAPLLAGQPAVSDVMSVSGTPVIALAAPVRLETPAVSLLLLADVHAWPLQTYESSLLLGPSSATYVVDGRGRVAASSVLESVGDRMPELPARVTGGGSGILSTRRGGAAEVVSYAPAGHGWTTVQVQGTSAFNGGLVSRSRREAIVVVVLLTVVALLLGGFNNARQRALRRLAEDRLYDPLTGLGARALFEFRLDSALARQRRTGVPLVLVYCDLDGFKATNDSFGHGVGDQLLVTVGERLRAAVREDDFVARLGGDEFVLVIEGTDLYALEEVIRRLRANVQRAVVLDGHTIHPRVSVGAAVLRDPSRAAELVNKADLAMYDVKRGATASGIVVLDAPVDLVPSTTGTP